MPLSLVKSHLQRNVEPLAARLLSPAGLANIALKIPHRVNRAVVEQLANRAFQEQIDDGDFDFLEGRTLQVEIVDARLFTGLGFENGRIVCRYFGGSAGEADATLAIESLHAIQLVQQEIDPDTLFFQRRLRISGDTELAHHVKNTIDTLDPSIIPTPLLKLARHYQHKVLQAQVC